MKKLLVVILSVVIMIGNFTGCKSSTQTSSTTNTQQKTKIEFFNVKPEVADIYKTLIAKFEKENPGIIVEQISVPDPVQVLQTRLQSNNMPDVFGHWSTDPGFKAMVDNGAVMDLTGQEFLNNVKPDMLEGIKLNGKVYDLPISMNTAGVFYNTKIFKDNNLTVPKTYTEFIDLCKKLKNLGIAPLEMSNKDAGQSAVIAEMLQVMAMPDYPQVIIDMNSGKLKAENKPAFTTIAKKLLEIEQYAQPDAAGTGYDQALADFANGKSAMLIQGIWVIPVIKKDNPSLQFDSFALPPDNGEQLRLAYQNDHCLAISATTKHKEAALKFLEFMSKPENAQYYADNDGSPSYIKGVKTKIVEPQNLCKYFDSKDSVALWPDNLWRAGELDEYNRICQGFVSSKDMNKYLSDCDSLFGQK